MARLAKPALSLNSLIWKLKPGGRVGLITPLSLMSGEAWDKSRKKLAGHYKDVVLVSIAAQTRKILSFSADTGMAEAMFVGTKVLPGRDVARTRNVCRTPRSPGHAARWICSCRRNQERACRRRHSLHRGWSAGGTPIRIGDDLIGYAIDVPLPVDATWDICRIGDLALAQAASKLISEGIVVARDGSRTCRRLAAAARGRHDCLDWPLSCRYQLERVRRVAARSLQAKADERAQERNLPDIVGS